MSAELVGLTRREPWSAPTACLPDSDVRAVVLGRQRTAVTDRAQG